MTIDRKELDDFDAFCDFDEKLDSSDSDGGSRGMNHPLSWRRLMIERAVNNVKNAFENKANTQNSYKKGTLVFDSAANKFGRVIESRPGFLNLNLLDGREVTHKDVDHLEFVRENRQKLTLTQMAKELTLSELQVIDLLNQLELESETRKKANEKKEQPRNKSPKTVKAAPRKKVERAAVISKDFSKPVKKHEVKIAAQPKKTRVPQKAVNTKSSPVSFAKLLPKGATTDPVVDPNGYIQQNFLLMNNRELAVATGLSEHTIRRKLGEWNLKRRDFLQKA